MRTRLNMSRKPLTLGYVRTTIVKRIEVEYGQTFPEVIQGYVDDGLNKSMVAGVLEYNRKDFWRKLRTMERAGITFNWPDGYATRDNPPHVNTPARQAASAANLIKAQIGSEVRWSKNRRSNLALVEAAIVLREQGLPWLTIAGKLDVDVGTLRRARRLHPLPDPLGDKLKVAAQKKFTGSKL